MYDVDTKRKTLPDVEFDATHSTSSSNVCFDCSIEKYFEEEKILRYTSFVACSYRIYVDKLSKWRNVLFYLQKINK